jgi:ketosteroid isomerase-like protein
MNTLYYGDSLKILRFVILLVAVFSGNALAQAEQRQTSGAQREVIKTDNEIRKAIVAADTTALDRLLADEWTVTHTNGKQQTKAQFLEAFRSGRVRFERMDLDDVKIQVFGNTAVLTARITDKVVFKGEPAEGQVRVISIYIKRDHRWQNLTEQATHIDQ